MRPRGKRQRTRTGRGPDAGRTIESKETDADRTRTGRGQRRFSQFPPKQLVSSKTPDRMNKKDAPICKNGVEWALSAPSEVLAPPRSVGRWNPEAHTE
eukprot:gene10463-biopygen22819